MCISTPPGKLSFWHSSSISHYRFKGSSRDLDIVRTHTCKIYVLRLSCSISLLLLFVPLDSDKVHATDKHSWPCCCWLVLFVALECNQVSNPRSCNKGNHGRDCRCGAFRWVCRCGAARRSTSFDKSGAIGIINEWGTVVAEYRSRSW
jgi:hypothetical protein